VRSPNTNERRFVNIFVRLHLSLTMRAQAAQGKPRKEKGPGVSARALIFCEIAAPY
jgi:hypothetical protein